MGKKPLRSEIDVRLRLVRGADIIMGPGRADLLGHIQATGSIAAAGRQMGMSYKRAWALVEAMNCIFAAPVVEASKGGVGGGGARLTAVGLRVLRAYRGLEASVSHNGTEFLEELNTVLPVPPTQKDR